MWSAGMACRSPSCAMVAPCGCLSIQYILILWTDLEGLYLSYVFLGRDMFGQVSILAHYICTASSRTFPHLQRTNCSRNIYHFCLSNPQFPLFKIQPCLSISTCSTISSDSSDASPVTISSDASPVTSMNIMNGYEWWPPPPRMMASSVPWSAWAKAATRPPVVGRHVCSSPRPQRGPAGIRENIEAKVFLASTGKSSNYSWGIFQCGNGYTWDSLCL